MPSGAPLKDGGLRKSCKGARTGTGTGAGPQAGAGAEAVVGALGVGVAATES